MASYDVTIERPGMGMGGTPTRKGPNVFEWNNDRGLAKYYGWTANTPGGGARLKFTVRLGGAVSAMSPPSQVKYVVSLGILR